MRYPRGMDISTGDLMDLLDWKRRIFDLYAEVRAEPDPLTGWQRWRAVRGEMFATHPQSPLPPTRREGFAGLAYFDYDPAYRVVAAIEPLESVHYEIGTSADGAYGFTRFGVVRFELQGHPVELETYWVDGYGGGLFLPFRDSTSGHATYGAGRYLLDTIKGSYLGDEAGGLVLDFNFAYNPSCSYDSRWACPLAPPPNRLADVAIEAGEKHL